jgi:hypothetical protein
MKNEYRGPERRRGDRRRLKVMDCMDAWISIGAAGRWIAITLGAVVGMFLFMLFYTLMYVFFG